MIELNTAEMDLNYLNRYYNDLSPWERLERLYESYSPDDILLTSSFGSTSVVLLHMISRVRPDQPIHFIDTGYHFNETLQYKEELKAKFSLNLINLKAEDYLHEFTHKYYTYHHNQDLCCFINKVDPMDQIKKDYRIWISGLFRFQKR